MKSFYHRPVTMGLDCTSLREKCGFLFFKTNASVKLSTSGYVLSIPKISADLERKPDFLLITVEENNSAYTFFVPTSPVLGNEDGYLKLINFKNSFYLPSQYISIRLHPTYEYQKEFYDPIWKNWLELNSRIFMSNAEKYRLKLSNAPMIRYYGGEYAI